MAATAWLRRAWQQVWEEEVVGGCQDCWVCRRMVEVVEGEGPRGCPAGWETWRVQSGQGREEEEGRSSLKSDRLRQ